MIPNLEIIKKLPELKSRLLYTLVFLAIYRLGIFVSVPGLNLKLLREQLEGMADSIFGIVNLFSGGALENFSMFTLGIAPYISVSIIVQLLTPVVPYLDSLRKEGEAGRKQLTSITRRGTILLALIQSYFITLGLERSGIVLNPGWEFRIVSIVTLTGGTAFLMWLGEQITEKGLGNGISVLIFAGIVARVPTSIASVFELYRQHEITALSVLVISVFIVVCIWIIVFFETTVRKVPVFYPSKKGSLEAMSQQQHFIPIKFNPTGVLPPIFAYALLAVPSTILGFAGSEQFDAIRAFLARGLPVYELFLAGLIIMFTYFYVTLVFNPEEMAENLRKSGAFVPGYRPGSETAKFFEDTLYKISLWASLYLAGVCVIPESVFANLNVTSLAFVFGGTAILIAISVSLDIINQLQAMIVSGSYEEFVKSAEERIKSLKKQIYRRNIR
ncbi:MAG: preprotein translocase subunit SecY [Deltaproteobacteria bacterium]|nr:preprotein translocase subunit SecY [Deltaproteobacteria bacterium]